ncbi:unnamed protein product [Ophioblennius macclurei]
MELMMSGWRRWRSDMLLLLLMLLTGSQAQSGDADVESRISCTSHISIQGSSLTCQLLPGTRQEQDQEQDQDEDQDQDKEQVQDQDEEADSIKHMRLCYSDYADQGRTKYFEADGNTINSKELTPLLHLNLTVYLRKGGLLWTTVDLKKIVKPRSPVVWNVSIDHEAGQLLVYVRTPYQNDYLNEENQMFQVLLSINSANMTLNMSSKHVLSVHTQQLQPSSEYQVRVRSIPQAYLQGSWSPWSSAVHFTSPAAEEVSEAPVRRWELPVLTVCLVVVVVIMSSMAVLQRDRICSHMWPKVPHPKHTLLHVYTTSTRHPALLLRLQPDVFSALRVFTGDTQKESAGDVAPSHRTDLLSSWSSTSSSSAEEQEESTQLMLGNRQQEEVTGEQKEVTWEQEEVTGEQEEVTGRQEEVTWEQEEVTGEQEEVTGRQEEVTGGQEEMTCQEEEQEAYVTMSSFNQQKYEEQRGCRILPRLTN